MVPPASLRRSTAWHARSRARTSASLSRRRSLSARRGVAASRAGCSQRPGLLRRGARGALQPGSRRRGLGPSAESRGVALPRSEWGRLATQPRRLHRRLTTAAYRSQTPIPSSARLLCRVHSRTPQASPRALAGRSTPCSPPPRRWALLVKSRSEAILDAVLSLHDPLR
jgi:hypothetical protein